MQEEIKPMVSVWMITYNHEKYIAQAIESVLMQKTTFPLELVIGEDCSIDGTAGIVKEYADKYPHIIKSRFNQQNIGMGENAILTLNECSGKYIAMLEGDDYWLNPEKLQIQVNILESDDTIGLCFTDYKNLKNNDFIKNDFRDKELNLTNCLNKSGNIFYNLLAYNFIGTLTVVTRKKIINNFLKDPIFNGLINLPMLDYQMWLYITWSHKAYYLPHEMGVYRIISDSASHPKNFKKIFAFNSAVLEIKSTYCKKFHLPAYVTTSIVSECVEKMLFVSYYTNHFVAVKTYFSRLQIKNQIRKSCKIIFIYSISESFLRHIIFFVRKIKNLN